MLCTMSYIAFVSIAGWKVLEVIGKFGIFEDPRDFLFKYAEQAAPDRSKNQTSNEITGFQLMYVAILNATTASAAAWMQQTSTEIIHVPQHAMIKKISFSN